VGLVEKFHDAARSVNPYCLEIRVDDPDDRSDFEIGQNLGGDVSVLIRR